MGCSIDCTWKGWGVKCNTCAHVKHGWCSYKESPEEHLDQSEATFLSGQDSLTCKSFIFLHFFLFANWLSAYIFIDLHSLLDQMNNFRNMGNANAALATLNFNHHDRLADEFLHWVFCLIGEDAPKALVDNYFNKERVMDAFNEILKEIPIPNVDLPRPADMDHYFCQLVRTVHTVKVEDSMAQTLVQQLQQENASCQHHLPSPPIVIRDNADDDNFYIDANLDDIPLDAVCNESDPDNLLKHPDDLIDDEAKEVPEGEESSPATSEQGSSGSSGSSSGSLTLGSEDSGSEGEPEPSDELGAPPSLD